MSFKELKQFYSDYFSLGYLNVPEKNGHSSFERKIILVSLICYVVEKNKPKNPDLTHYALLYKLNSKLELPDDFLKGLAIICEDFSYHCHDFPTFGLEGKDILKEIVEILKTYVPF